MGRAPNIFTGLFIDHVSLSRKSAVPCSGETPAVP